LNSYVAQDGRWFWLIAAEADRHWPALIAATGEERLADERFATARGRRRAGDDLMVLLDEAFARRSRDEWAQRFDEHGVWWTPVNTVEDLLNDPQADAARLFVDVPTNREGDNLTDRSLAAPTDFGSQTNPVFGPPPSVGADTAEVLRGLGVDPHELAKLQRDGVISGPSNSTTERCVVAPRP